MPQIDYEQEYANFLPFGGDGTGAIKEIYNIIPSLDQEQMMIVHQLNYFIKKWELQDLKSFLESYLETKKQNKNLGFLSSMNLKTLIKGYANDEIIRGVTVSNSRQEKV